VSASRWPVVAVIFGALTAAALLASVILSWTDVHAAASTVARGDAQRVTRHVQAALDALGHPASSTELDAIRDELASDGVVYVAVQRPDGELASGTPAPGFDARAPEPGDVDRSGETWRAVAILGPPRHPRDRDRPPPPPFEPHGPPGFGPPHGPPRIVIELVPRTALALERRATITLAVGVLSALLVVATSLALRRAAVERERALRTSERTKHLTSLGEMSAVLAHEIRNPLASLKGHAQLLEESLPGGTRDRAKAERVVHEAQRIERLTTDLLAFVRSGTLAPRTADPRAVVQAAIESAGEGRTRLTDHGAPARAPIDEDRVRGALENLIRNACEAAPEGEIEVTMETDDDAIEIRVRDHGKGIALGDEEKIFEPFHTTRVHGTGLGLSVARRIAEAHGGSLVAGNAKGGGAVFTMRLALAPLRVAGG
jgi:two-component system sensor histidine kinase HydH